MFSLDFGAPAWFILFCLVFAGGLTWLMYSKPKTAIKPPALRYGLIGLRFVTLFLAAFLLLKPLVSLITEERQPPIVAIALDDSQSMTAGADSGFVRNQLPENIRNLAEALAEEDVVVDFFRFGTEVNDLDAIDSLGFSATGSHPAAVLRSLKDRFANQNLAATVLVSDGIATMGNNPIDLAEGFPAPVFTLLTGDTTERRDVLVETVLYNEISYVNTETPVEATIRGKGLEEAQKLRVDLLQGDAVLKSTTVNLVAGSNYIATAKFYLKLTQPGLQQFTVRVEGIEGESNAKNNSRLFYINVLESKVNIALLGGAPHPDIGALSRTFGASERYKLQKYIRKNENSFYENPSNINWQEIDLVILHNFPASVNDRPVVERLLKAIDDQDLPVVHLVGANTRLNISPDIMEYMVAVPEPYIDNATEAFLYFTPQYRDHASFRFENPAAFNGFIESAPPLLRNASEWRVKGEAVAYGKAKLKGIAMDYPMFVLGERQGAKNMVLTGEGIWRYRMHAYAEAEDFKYFDEWWGNLVQWLTARKDKRRFKVYPIKRLFEGDERVVFKGQVYDEAYNPLEGAEIKLEVTDPDGQQLEFFLRESSPGNYIVDLNVLEEGTYEYVAVGEKGTENLGTDRGQFSVGSSTIEFVELQANAPVMRQLAIRTGGGFFYAQNADGMEEDLLQLPTLRNLIQYREQTTGLHHWLPLLLIIFGLLTLEWVLRKRNGLL